MLQSNAATISPCVPDLPRHRDHALLADRPVSVKLFPGQLESTFSRLRASRLRFSVMRLRLSRMSAGDPSVARRLAAHMADPHVLIGLWHDGSVVGAFFGPRAKGAAGDRAQTRQIVERCRRALVEIGEAGLMQQAHLLIAHRWTDEVFDLPGLIDALELAEEVAA